MNVPDKWSLLLRRAFTLGMAGALSACAVLQPHIDVPPDPLPPATPDLAGALGPQLERGKALQQRYLNAVADQTLATNGLALISIPLAASALAVGIASNGTAARNFLIGAGAGGATALGVGGFLIDRRRDLIYYSGAKSIYCLRVAITPLAMSEDTLRQMQSDVDRLRAELGRAAAAGVDPSLIASSTNVFAAGSQLVRETAASGATFSRELDNINIGVNAQLAADDRTLTDIASAISSIQKVSTSWAGQVSPSGRSQSSRAAQPSSGAALRYATEMVATWLAANQAAATATAADLKAAQCPGAGSAGVGSTLVIANGQSVVISTTDSGTTTVGNAAPPAPVVTGQPPPPQIPMQSLPANVSLDDLHALRAALDLSPDENARPDSPDMMTAVMKFQSCKGLSQTGRLTDGQKRAVLSLTDACLPKPHAAGGGTGAAAGVPGTAPIPPPPPIMSTGPRPAGNP